MKKRDIINELRRTADQLEAGEDLMPPDERSNSLADDVVDTLADRLGLCPLPAISEIEHINDVSHASLVDALHALAQAGCLHVEIHPAFWAEWGAMLNAEETSEAQPGGHVMTLPKEYDADEANGARRLPKHTLVKPWRACARPHCPTCRYLGEQWAHRGANKAARQLNPELN